MRKIALMLGACLVLFGEPSLAQPIDRDSPIIIVVGRGRALHAADYGIVTFTVRGEGATNVQALKALAIGKDRIEDGLRALADVKSVETQTGEFSVKAARDKACDGVDDDSSYTTRLSSGNCEIKGYVASLAFTAKIFPANRTGDAGSLAAQLGAVDVASESGGLTNPHAGLEEATRMALDDAHQQALDIAHAAGVELGPIIRVQDNSATFFESPDQGPMAAKSIAHNLPPPPPPPPPPMSPAAPLSLTLPPIEATISYTVIYSIVR